MPQAHIHALLVAIDHYPRPVPKLGGCVNDLLAFKDYLSAAFADSHTLQLEALVNARATRANIIRSFEALARRVQAGDVALFYFSGHGAQSPAPKEFWLEESDKQLESIVCYDSRLPDGFDLMDKELSCLIAEVCKKGPHFVSIMDCCHSGSGTRAAGVKVRQVGAGNVQRKVSDFYGYASYQKIQGPQGLQLVAPKGRHLALSACRDEQTAKELHIQGRRNGAFTHSVLQALKSAGGRVSYLELLHRIETRIANMVSNQHPQLEVIGGDKTFADEKYKLFLDGTLAERPRHYTLSYDQGLQSWTMNAGQVQGVSAAAGNKKQEVLVFSPSTTQLAPSHALQKVALASVSANRSVLEPVQGLNTAHTYKAKLAGLPTKQLPVTIDPKGETEGLKHLHALMGQRKNSRLVLTPDLKKAKYRIQAKKGTYLVKRAGREMPVFKRIAGYSRKHADWVLTNLERIARWEELSEINNPQTQLRVSLRGNHQQSVPGADISIEVKRLTLNEYFQLVEEKRLPLDQELVLQHQYDPQHRFDPSPDKSRPDDWMPPIISVHVQNISQRSLWFSVAQLSADYGIYSLTSKKQLHAGEGDYVRTNQGGYMLGIGMDPAFSRWKIERVKERFKLFVGTEPMDLSSWEQAGLPLDNTPPTGKRLVFFSQPVSNQQDWTTVDLAFTLVKPLKAP